SYIQSRGRARKIDSKYIVMINKSNIKEVARHEKIMRAEKDIKRLCQNLGRENKAVLTMLEDEDLDVSEYSSIGGQQRYQQSYVVPSTGARLSLDAAISIIYNYCSNLPTDTGVSDIIGVEADSLLVPEFDLIYNGISGYTC